MRQEPNMGEQRMRWALFVAALFIVAAMAPTAAFAAQTDYGIDFGDDAGQYANDEECDDMRFSGDGMTETPLLFEDIGHDSSDCRDAYERGDVALAPLFVRLENDEDIVWGDDGGEYARNGECDDLRFGGAGMTDTPLLFEDVGRDATDCRVAYQQGRLEWTGGMHGPASAIDRIVWGDDAGEWANDGECDDMRFDGEGMTETPLLADDVGHDASDCRAAFAKGTVVLRE